MEFLWVFVKGFFVAAGLIVAIGAQNAFVLSQGVRKQYVTEMALICATIDTVLIISGVAGMGALIEANPNALWWATLGGAVFLSFYALAAAYRAFNATSLGVQSSVSSRYKAIMTCLALSLLNPHVYLDTVILIGSIGGALEPVLQPVFTVGACLASFTWFFLLSYGARFLRPYLSSARSWQVLDGFISVTMLLISITLWRQIL